MERGLMLVTALGLLITAFTTVEGSYNLGIVYGMQGDNLPQPNQAILDIYLKYHIDYMRLYDTNPAVLDALRGSTISVIVGIPNDMLKTLASDPVAANGWLRLNILPYWSEIFFTYIVVGNEAIPGDQAQFVLPAMKNLNNSITAVGYDTQVRLTTAVGMSVLGKSHPPSAGTFSNDAVRYMRPIVQFLTTAPIGGALLVNVYPYYAYAANPRAIPLEYALFTSPGTVVQDGVLGYQNLFHAMLDALYWALEQMGGSQVRIVVSETGWPTARGNAASNDMAQIYISNLIKNANRGTPKRPFVPIHFYISSLFNENLKRPQGVGNHFGLFYPNMQPVYPINFTN